MTFFHVFSDTRARLVGEGQDQFHLGSSFSGMAPSPLWLVSLKTQNIPQKTPNPVRKPMARTLYKGLSPRTMMLSTTSSSRLVRRDGGYPGARGCNQEPLGIFLKYSPALNHIGTLPFLSSLFSLSKAIARALSQLLNNFISISAVRAKPLTLKTLKREKKKRISEANEGRARPREQLSGSIPARH